MSDDMVMVTISKKAASKQIKRKAKTFAVPETTNIVSVIGSDTYLGAHMVKHLSAYAKTVYGFSQEKDFIFSAKPIAEHGGTGLAFPPPRFFQIGCLSALNPVLVFRSTHPESGNCMNIFPNKDFMVNFASFLLSRYVETN